MPSLSTDEKIGHSGANPNTESLWRSFAAPAGFIIGLYCILRHTCICLSRRFFGEDLPPRPDRLTRSARHAKVEIDFNFAGRASSITMASATSHAPKKREGESQIRKSGKATDITL
jgi:hypothetical protein